jgi:hypothetical protein
VIHVSWYLLSTLASGWATPNHPHRCWFAR